MESVFKDTGGRGRSSLDRNSSGKREFGVAGSSKDCNKKLRIEEVSNQIDGRRSAETGLEQRRVLGRVERGKEQAQERVCTRKDRHSKVNTSKGPRDRRVRLSVSTAIQFYDVQDRLGVDQPSKAVEWLIRKAKAAIDELEDLPAPAPPAEHMLQPLPHPDPVPVTSSLLACPPELHSACSYGSASPGLLKMCEERMQASRAKTKDRERAKARERAKEKLRSKEGGDSKLLLVNSEPFGLDWFHSHIIPDSSSCYHRAWPGSQACVDEEARPMSQQLYPHQPTISPSSFALDLQPTSSPPFPHQQFCASGWPPPVADVPLTAGPVEMDEDGDKQRQQRPVALQEQQAATEYWQTDDVANVVGGAASSHSHSLSMGPLQSIPAAYMPAVFPSTAMSVFPHHSQQHGPQRMCDYNPSGSSLFEQGRCSPRIEDVEAELKNTS